MAGSRTTHSDPGYLESPMIIVPRLPDLQPLRRTAIFPIGHIEMQAKLILIYQLTLWNAVNPNRPWLGPEQPTAIQVLLGECVVGEG